MGGGFGPPGRRRLGQVGKGLLILTIVGIASLLLGRSYLERRVAAEVSRQIQARLPGEARVGSVRLDSFNRVDLHDFYWKPEKGPLESVTVRRLTVRASPWKWMKGERRVEGVELHQGEVMLAPLTTASKEETEPPSTEAVSPEVRLVALLRKAVEKVQVKVPSQVGQARSAMDTVLLPGARVEFDDVTVNGLPSDLSISHLRGTATSGSGRGVALQISGNFNRGGQFKMSADLEPATTPRVHLDLEDLRLDDVIPGEDPLLPGLRTEGGGISVGISIEPPPVGEGPLLGIRMKVADATLWAEAFDNRPWHVDATQDILVQPSPKGVEVRRWNFSLGKVEGQIETEVTSLDLDPKFSFAAILEHVSLPDLVEALPDGTLPEAWGFQLQGDFSVKAELAGPLSDRQYWTFEWKGDGSRMQAGEGGTRDLVASLKDPTEFVFQRSYHDPISRYLGPADSHFASLGAISHGGRMAVVAAEDAGFYGHHGFDMEGIQEAVLENLREGGEGRGGSTITQQLAKNLFLSQDRTVIRKVREAVLAWHMEKTLSKNRILELYLNICEWGMQVYGIRDASQHYFGKEPDQLRPREGAFLALLLPSPRRYHDYYHATGKVTDHLQHSIDGMVRRMHRLGFIDEETYVREMTWGLSFSGCSHSGQAPYNEPPPPGPPPEEPEEGSPDDLTFWDLEGQGEPGMPAPLPGEEGASPSPGEGDKGPESPPRPEGGEPPPGGKTDSGPPGAGRPPR